MIFTFAVSHQNIKGYKYTDAVGEAMPNKKLCGSKNDLLREKEILRRSILEMCIRNVHLRTFLHGRA